MSRLLYAALKTLACLVEASAKFARMPRSKPFLSGLITLVWTLLLLLRPAYAQQAEANVLFDEGRNLMAGGRYEEAIDRLKQSNQLDPAVGTWLNLGECYGALGRTASAWTAYREAATLAANTKQRERERFATDKVAELEAQLSKLEIFVPAAARVPELQISRNGVSVPAGLWGLSVPVDPGAQRIEARAPGKLTWNSEVTVRGAADKVRVEIPVLQATPAPSAPPSEPAPKTPPAPVKASEPTSQSASTLRTAGWIALGAGAVGVAVGIGLYLDGRSTIEDANCPNEICVIGVGDKSVHDEGRLREQLGVGVSIFGVAAAAAGTVMLALSNEADAHSDTRAARLSLRINAPFVSKDAGVGLVGQW